MYSTAFGVALNCTLCSVPDYKFSLRPFSTVLSLYIFAVWTKKYENAAVCSGERRNALSSVRNGEKCTWDEKLMCAIYYFNAQQ